MKIYLYICKKKEKRKKLHVTCSWKEEVYLRLDVPSDIRGVVEYCDSLYILLSPVGSELV